MKWPSDNALKSINRCLLVIIIGTNGYLLLAPIWPKVHFVIQANIIKPVKVDVKSEDALAGIDTTTNHLVIPKLQMDEPILDGKSEYTVHRGIWRRPNTTMPGQGGNSVLVGHRFTYSGPSVFYHLDKLAPGDDIVAAYNGKLYVYKVDVNRVVEPNDPTVEAAYTTEKLTLYTCAPLGSVRYRLVVEAHLERML